MFWWKTLALVAVLLASTCFVDAATVVTDVASTPRFEPTDYEVLILPNMHADHLRARRTRAPLLVSFAALGRLFSLRLGPTKGLFAPGFAATVVGDKGPQPLRIDQTNFYHGTVAGDATSSVRLRVEEDGHVHATILADGARYYVEPLHSYARRAPLSGLHRIFSGHAARPTQAHPGTSFCGHDHHPAEMAAGSTSRAHGGPVAQATAADVSETLMGGLFGGNVSTHNRARRVGVNGNALKTTCEIALIADQRYYARMGDSNAVTTANKIIGYLDDVSNIYFATDFGNSQTQIQLALRILTVYTSMSASGNPFQLVNGVDPTASLDFLNQLTSKSWPTVCVAHAFTYLEFANGVLGLAWVGTVCQPPAFNGNSQNTGITTANVFGSASSTLQTTLVMAHEIGHNFGMSHDNVCSSYCSLHASECSSSTELDGGAGGNYIMWPNSVDGLSQNNNLFSGCSRDSAGNNLQSNGFCFTNTGSGPICGNGIVQEGEDCDCGQTDQTACDAVDNCCTTLCKLKPTSACSPLASQCCNASCGLTGYPATVDLQTDLVPGQFVCRAGTSCQMAAVCIQDVTLKGVCPEASYEDTFGTNFFLANNSLCNGGSNLCVDGECAGSLCTQYGVAECLLSGAAKSCEVACLFDGVTCASTFDQGGLVTGAHRAVGKSCNNFLGYCTLAGTCQGVSNQSPINIIFGAALGNWLITNWYVPWGIAVGLVVLAFVLRCTYRQRDTGVFMRQQLRALGSRARGVMKPRASRINARGVKAAENELRFKQMAVVLEESERMRSSKLLQHIDEGFFRLTNLFPHTPESVLRAMIKGSPHEEAAVMRLLALGHPMRLATDYKELVYAAKIYERAHPAAVPVVPAQAHRSTAFPVLAAAGKGPKPASQQAQLRAQQVKAKQHQAETDKKVRLQLFQEHPGRAPPPVKAPQPPQERQRDLRAPAASAPAPPRPLPSPQKHPLKK